MYYMAFRDYTNNYGIIWDLRNSGLLTRLMEINAIVEPLSNGIQITFPGCEPDIIYGQDSLDAVTVVNELLSSYLNHA